MENGEGRVARLWFQVLVLVQVEAFLAAGAGSAAAAAACTALADNAFAVKHSSTEKKTQQNIAGVFQESAVRFFVLSLRAKPNSL